MHILVESELQENSLLNSQMEAVLEEFVFLSIKFWDLYSSAI